jgi:hypothetical protein
MEWGTPEPKNRLSNQFIVVLIEIWCKDKSFPPNNQEKD